MTRGRWALAIASIGAVACVFVTGCLPYYYPKLDYIPACNPTSPKVSDIYVFRVDATVEMHSILEDREHTIAEITIRPDGSIPPQVQLSLDRRTFTFIGEPMHYFDSSRVHVTRVRLYSPGYRLIELQSWDSTDKLSWQPAPDWRDQEQALIGLLASPQPTTTSAAPSDRDLSLPPNNPSFQIEANMAWSRLLPLTPSTPRTKRVFELAISECERLAKCAPTAEDADQIRRLAERLIERKAEASKQSD